MNRVEFQNWLNAFPEDTEIHVGIQQSAPDYCPYGECGVFLIPVFEQE